MDTPEVIPSDFISAWRFLDSLKLIRIIEIYIGVIFYMQWNALLVPETLS